LIVPEISAELRGSILLGLTGAEGVAIEPSGPALLSEIEDLAHALAAEHFGRPPGEITALEPARRLYKAFGIDPTRTRPSSEALLRRVLQGKPLPRISNAVDLCNHCALRFLLPIGLYDAGKIKGAVTLRRGRAGESYPGIRKEDVHLEGRPILADAEGPFGNPTSDSLRTCVDGTTRSLWMVIFAPSGYPRDRLEGHVAFVRDGMARHLPAPGGSLTTTGLLVP